MTESHQPDAHRQALRLKRFFTALATYVIGWLFLLLCSAVDLFPPLHVVWIGMGFTIINVIFYVFFRSGFNLRFEDPSLTAGQVYTGVACIFFILILGADTHFLAIPFYSALFIYAMLRFTLREMIHLEIFVLLSYGAAIGIRHELFAWQLDLRVEFLYATIVTISSFWYAGASTYISNLRARLRRSIHSLEQLAIRDDLTDTWNRRHIDTLLGAEIERKNRLGGSLCVFMVDLDHFKTINDRYGHPAGDLALRSVAASMKHQVRSMDQVGRFGGEEFLIVLPGTALTEAQQCAQRLLASVAQLNILPDPNHRITVSVGLAQCKPNETAHSLLKRADDALYQAKRDGRNRVILAE